MPRAGPARSTSSKPTSPQTDDAFNPSHSARRRDMSHGTFCWNELMTHDAEKAKAFYSKVVGWAFDAMPMVGGGGTYWVAKVGDKQVGGIFTMNGPEYKGMEDRWVSILAVDNVDARVKKATS